MLSSVCVRTAFGWRGAKTRRTDCSTPITKPCGASMTVPSSMVPISSSASCWLYTVMVWKAHSTRNEPTIVAVMSLRPEKATHTIGMAAAGSPMLAGVMYWPQDV
ncbi:hypothetical protein D9M69_651290 [compost metagenome]